MSRFLNTSGNSIIAIAVCDRCRMKRAYVDLSADPNSPGLRVCRFGCADDIDPYRLPPPPSEIITLEFPRPDEAITVPDVLLEEYSNPIIWSLEVVVASDSLITQSGDIDISTERNVQQNN